MQGSWIRWMTLAVALLGAGGASASGPSPSAGSGPSPLPFELALASDPKPLPPVAALPTSFGAFDATPAPARSAGVVGEVPEPSTFGLLLLGLFGLTRVGRRRALA